MPRACRVCLITVLTVKLSIASIKSRHKCLSSLENVRYGHAPMRSDTSIRVYTTTDTDTSTPCAGVPATCNIRPGRSLRERRRNGRHMQTISNKQTCALSQFYDWLIGRNVRVIDSWLLLSLPAGGGVWRDGGWDQYWRSLCHGEAGIRLRSPSASLPSNSLPYHGP